MRLTLVKPDLTSHVLGQQSKMKMHHDKRANFGKWPWVTLCLLVTICLVRSGNLE